MIKLIENFVSILENSITILTAFTVILGAISFAMVSISKYNQSKELGIPYRLSQISINEILDVWVEIFMILVVGCIFPKLLVIINLPLLHVFFIYFLLIYFGSIGLSNIFKRYIWKFLGKIISIIVVFTWFIVIITSYMVFQHEIHNLDNYGDSTIYNMASSFIVAYMAILLTSATLIILENFVNSKVIKEPIITCIEGKIYIITFRFNQNNYILVPCNIYETKSKILYKKGEFIIKSIEGLKINHKEGYKVLEE